MTEFTHLVDLASERIGGRAIATNDDFFAEKENLLKRSAPVFIPDKYTDRGKWMDGWESRRRRTPGHDWCIVALGFRGRIRGVDVNTRFFTGNFPTHCSLDAIDSATVPPRPVHAVNQAAHPQCDHAPVMSRCPPPARFPPVHPLAARGVFAVDEDRR